MNFHYLLFELGVYQIEAVCFISYSFGEGGSLDLLTGNSPSASSFYLCFSYSVNLRETIVSCGLEGLFLCKSVPA